MYFWRTQGYHGLLRHLTPRRVQPLDLLGWGRGRRHLLGLGGRWRRHLLRLGGRGRRLLLRLRWAGAAAPPPSPASLMARLTPCACLRKENLLDSLLGDQRWWFWDFLGATVDEVLGRPGFIFTRRRIVRRSVTHLGTRVRSGELLATKIMWSQGDVSLFIFYSKYQMPNYSYELFDS
jgi:hypothetical protein